MNLRGKNESWFFEAINKINKSRCNWRKEREKKQGANIRRKKELISWIQGESL